MKLPKLCTSLTLMAFGLNALCAPLHADPEPPYKTVVGGGAYCECKKAPHLAALILGAGVMLAMIIAVAIKAPNESSHSH